MKLFGFSSFTPVSPVDDHPVEMSVFTVQGHQASASRPLERGRFSLRAEPPKNQARLPLPESVLNTAFITEQFQNFIASLPVDLADGWQEIETKEGKYTGPIVNGEPKGHGSIVVPLGEYEGDWPQGEGVLKTLVSTIKGHFDQGKCHGPATGTFVSLERLRKNSAAQNLPQADNFAGEYVEGRCEGKGRFEGANGEVYDGDFKNGKREGNCLYINPNGDIFIGAWADGIRKGVLTTSYGVIYEGEFVNEKLAGEGNCTYPDGNRYQGQWREGKFHGHGVLTYRNGDVYEGNFQNDEMDGKGTYRQANGEAYVGEWQSGRKHGRGTLTSPEGIEAALNYHEGQLIE